MTYLRIENKNNIPEIINSSIIQKLYEFAYDIDLNLEEGLLLLDYVSLKGNLLSDHARQTALTYLNNKTKFPNLLITVPIGAEYIDFADPEVERILMTVYGDGVGICSSDVNTSYLNKSFKNNTIIRTFDELSQFTGVTLLPNLQFMRASNLTSIDTSRITHVGDNCITDTKITSLNLSSLTNIGGANAFSGNTLLTSIDFGLNSSLTALGATSFGGCTSLQTITIPTTVTTIPDYCFYNDSNLTTISGTSNVTSIGGSAFENCSKLTTIDISSVTALAWNSFKGCSKLNNITLNSGLTNIPSNCFNGCSSLTSIDIPSGVTTIGGSAFSGCTNLTTIDLSNITSVNAHAFLNCSSLTSVNLSSCTVFGQNVFNGCTSLTSVTLSPNLTEIPNVTSGGDANGFFRNCSSLLSITLPSSLTYIGTNAFLNCTSLLNVTFPSTLTCIRGNAFYNCNLRPSITIPKSVILVGVLAFKNNSNLSSITFELGRTESLEISGSSNLFSGFAYGCAKKLTVTLPDISITLGKGALSPTNSGSGVMTTYIFTSTTVPTVDTTIADNRSDTKARITIYVPDSALNDYKTNAGFVYFADCIFPVSEYTPSS